VAADLVVGAAGVVFEDEVIVVVEQVAVGSNGAVVGGRCHLGGEMDRQMTL